MSERILTRRRRLLAAASAVPVLSIFASVEIEPPEGRSVRRGDVLPSR